MSYNTYVLLRRLVELVTLCVKTSRVFFYSLCILEERGSVTKEQIQSLIGYYNLTGKLGKFFCNDLFVELSELLPVTKCISDENIDNNIRLANLNKAKSIIKTFLIDNADYMSRINQYSILPTDIDLYEYLLEAYLLYSLLLGDKPSNIDIFSDPRSICYLASPLKNGDISKLK